MSFSTVRPGGEHAASEGPRSSDAARERRLFGEQVREILPTASHLAARRVRDLLRAALRAGEFGSGRLPGEAELMAQYRVPRDVLREALDLLRRDGLIERRRGLGTSAVRAEYVVPGALPPQGHALDEHLAVGRITPRLLHWAWTPAPRVIAAHLDDTAAGDDCLCVEYVLLAEQRPLAVFTNYIRAPEAARVDQSLFRRDFYALLHSGGIDTASCDVGVQAAAADGHTAALLHVLPGEPVLLVQQRLRDAAGRVVDYALGTCRNELLIEIGHIPRVDLTGAHRKDSL
ncbi:GntR family transcriptional regulator [Nocardia blacklockiae]|uniref:GntR family transcriptional regulator n=1 Tax=Nocardia blacklockiae TaxID=480036 RepID=UPI0018940385|nr:GntR family transcriptional regulator [Nocardia blacklockiae]MBF6176768.1 GntR family transcriptional regulator [Nocardia blacklockiae]